jgi:nucleoside-diphosphate-sugar epimerase
MILVTGATGFVGQALINHLVNGGFSPRVVAAVRQSNLSFPKSVKLVQVGNLLPTTNWDCALEGVDTVVHCAARVHVMQDNANDPLEIYRLVNVQGTLNLARQAAQSKALRFVFISSIKVNGEVTQPGCPYTEDGAPAPQDAYGQSKFEAETGLRQLATETGMEVVIVRPPLIYGPGVKANFASLMRAIQSGWPLPLGAIHNQRSLVALDNLVDFILTCLSHPRAANQTFLVSDGHDLSTTELARGMARAAGVSPKLLSIPPWALQSAASFLGKGSFVQRLCGNLQADISKARNLLGWTPPITVEEGLKRTIMQTSASLLTVYK